MSVRNRIADYPSRHITRFLKSLLLRGMLLRCQKSLSRHWLPLYVCFCYLPTQVGVPHLAYSTLRYRRELDIPRLVPSLVRCSTFRRPYAGTTNYKYNKRMCRAYFYSLYTFALILTRDCPGSADSPSIRLLYIIHGNNRPHAA